MWSSESSGLWCLKTFLLKLKVCIWEYFHEKLNYFNTIKFKLNEYHSFVNDEIRRYALDACGMCTSFMCASHPYYIIKWKCSDARVCVCVCVRIKFIALKLILWWFHIVWHGAVVSKTLQLQNYCHIMYIVRMVFWDAPHSYSMCSHRCNESLKIII